MLTQYDIWYGHHDLLEQKGVSGIGEMSVNAFPGIVIQLLEAEFEICFGLFQTVIRTLNQQIGHYPKPFSIMSLLPV